MKIRRNDTVFIIAGKDRGKKGKVRKAFPTQKRVLVEGVNFIKQHMRQRGTTKQAGIIQREAPIHVSDVMLICTRCNQPTRVGFEFSEDNTKVRVCKKCHEVVA